MKQSNRRDFLLACVVAVFFLPLNSVAQAQNLGWAKAIHPGEGIAIDSSRNIFIAGSFTGSATFGSGEPNQTTLKSAGIDDIFISKYDSNGALIWAKRAGGTGIDVADAVAVDNSENSYITGRFGVSLSGTHTATFGAGEPNQTTLKPAGEDDMFVAKYNPNGQLVWAKRAGGTGREIGFGIAVDGSGNSYVTGFFSSPSATFGGGELNQTTLTSAGGNDVFVAKYNANGTLAWAKRAGGTDDDFAGSIAVDDSGNSYVAGRFSGVATFALAEANQTALTSAGGSDIFVAKYGSNGSLIWAKRAGGAGFEGGGAIALDSAGNSYITGTLFTAATFGPGEPHETTLMSLGGETSYLAKYDASGMLLWAKEVGGSDESDNAEGHGIAVELSGNSYVVGPFTGSVTFGSGEAYETALTSTPSDEWDIFVAKYDPNGALQWVTRAGGVGLDGGRHIAVDTSGNSYVSGSFTAPATFGSGQVNQTTLISGSSFLAKFESGIPIINCATQSLQLAVNQAMPGQTIPVTGTCNENILIRNEKQRITIDGAGGGVGTRATVNGSTGAPVFNVRGKGILIQNFNITGGANGIHVNRGSNAVLNNNVIHNSSGNGVLVDELGFAVLTNNTIENHPAAGIFVSENATARIGFNQDSETTASPNTIQNNGLGVVVSNNSSARVVANTIQNNQGAGIQVSRDSQAEIASNGISSNAGAGIQASENSAIQLGEDTGSSIFEAPNSGSGNTGAGVRCVNGGTVAGRQGSLTGNSGASLLDPNCVSALLP